MKNKSKNIIATLGTTLLVGCVTLPVYAQSTTDSLSNSQSISNAATQTSSANMASNDLSSSASSTSPSAGTTVTADNSETDPKTTPVIQTWSISDNRSTSSNIPQPNTFEVPDETNVEKLKQLDVPGFKIDLEASYFFEIDQQYSYSKVLNGVGITNLDELISALNQRPIYAVDGGILKMHTVLIPNPESIDISYVDRSTGKILASTQVQTKFGYTETIEHKSFDGYALEPNQPTTYHVVGDGEGTNKVTVYYTAKTTSGSNSSAPSEHEHATATSTTVPAATTSTDSKTSGNNTNTITTSNAPKENVSVAVTHHHLIKSNDSKLPQTSNRTENWVTGIGLFLIGVLGLASVQLYLKKNREKTTR